MKMRVADQLHMSAISANTMRAGDEFEVSDEVAADLERRGLATRVVETAKEEKPESGGEVSTSVSDQPAAKAEEAPANKAEAPPENKAAIVSVKIEKKPKPQRKRT